MYNLAVAVADAHYVQQKIRCRFNIIILFICMNAGEEFPLMLLFARWVFNWIPGFILQ